MVAGRVKGALAALVLSVALGGMLVAVPVAVPAAMPAAHARVGDLEGYATYQPQKRCAREVKRGTRMLARWTVRHGGSAGGMLRPCSSGGTSEHKDGRAFDWTLDATRRRDRRIARSFLRTIFAADRHGRPHARARRMGVMYVIWNDRMYAAWDRFRAEPYLSSSCRTTRRCSATLRHRDHMHVSLGRPGARARTSWYTR